jgi:DNA-binding GntR family transcriptional regulator
VPTAAVELIRRDLERSTISPDQRRALAKKLHLSGNDPLPGADQQEGLLTAVQVALESLSIGSLNEERLDQLGRIRAYFETIMALKIVKDAKKKAAAITRLKAIQKKLRSVLDDGALSASSLEACWSLDGEFHRGLCEVSGHRNLAALVDVVQQRCKSIGVPKSRHDVLSIWSEHQRILESMAEESSAEQRIFDAIHGHITYARQRWLARSRSMQETDMAVQQAIQQVRASVEVPPADLEEAVELAIRQAAECNGGPIPQTACDHIRESLVTQFLYAGKFVVYLDELTTIDGLPRAARRIFHVASTADEAIRWMETLPEADRDRAEVEYQPDPYCAAV